MEKIKVEKDSVEESYRWAYGWRVADGKCSPAMLKGIQKGDILVRAGTQQINSAADYMNVLRNVHVENSIDIVLRRASVNAYEEMHFMIQPVRQNEG